MTGIYRTVYADPPWDYGKKKWASITHNGTGPRIEKEMPYRSMSIAEICAIPVSDWVAEDCRLFLWVTGRHLPFAFEVIGAWGFTYAQTVVWRKTGNPSPFSGGGVAPIHHELLLVAKRGRPEVAGRLKTSVIDAPKPGNGKHSAKPECFYDHIEQVSPGPYLEMFSRAVSPRLGWEYHGHESLETAQLPEAVA